MAAICVHRTAGVDAERTWCPPTDAPTFDPLPTLAPLTGCRGVPPPDWSSPIRYPRMRSQGIGYNAINQIGASSFPLLGGPAFGGTFHATFARISAKFTMTGSSADHPEELSRVLEAELLRLRPGTPSINLAMDEVRRCEQVRLRVASLSTPLAALCLSGGGIRSAAFALGIVQGLARANLLTEFDYLSTASGGGYLGGWLTAWTHREGGDIRRVQAALRGSEDPAPVMYLRSHSRYLRPQSLTEAMLFASILLRNLLLYWLTLLPILLLPVMAPQVVLALIEVLPTDAIGGAVAWLLLGLAVVMASLAVNWVMRNRPNVNARAPGRREVLLGYVIPILLTSIAWTVWLARTVRHYSNVPHSRVALAFVVMVIGGGCIGAASVGRWASEWERGRLAHCATVLILAVLSTALFAWLTGYLILLPSLPQYAYVALGPLILLASCALFSAVSLLLGRRYVSTRDKEWVYRVVTWTLQAACAWGVICLLVFAAPGALMALGNWHAAGLIVAFLIVGVLGAAWSIVAPRLTSSWFAIGAFLSALIAVLLSLTVAINRMLGALVVLNGNSAIRLFEVTGLIAVLAVIGGLQFNVNRWSLSQIYRRQLIRVFLGASFTHRLPDSDASRDLAPEDIWIHSIGEHHRPFPVLNMAVNLVAPTAEARSVESFTVTPLHAGSSPLGYRPTRAYAGSLSLGTAMAISGAAVSPINAGGRRMSGVASLLLSLLMVRLGQWVGNPRDAQRWQKPAPDWALAALTREAFGVTDVRNPYVYLSDGGHFDNLGLYEMIVRRCRCVVVSDAGEDPSFMFEDLAKVVRRARVDLGIPIYFERGGDAPGEFERVGDAPRNFAFGRIEYSHVDGPGAPDGVLIYLKPVASLSDPQQVTAYASAHPIFPHHPTKDQWYDVSRFESYRALGVHSVGALTEGTLSDSWTLSGWVEHLRRVRCSAR
jgi:hypothetical protein